MKKVNKARQAILQQKRTKRNIARKGVKYDPNKLERRAKAALQAGTPSSSTTDDSQTIFTV
jgi:phage shock protein A